MRERTKGREGTAKQGLAYRLGAAAARKGFPVDLLVVRWPAFREGWLETASRNHPSRPPA